MQFRAVCPKCHVAWPVRELAGEKAKAAVIICYCGEHIQVISRMGSLRFPKVSSRANGE